VVDLAPFYAEYPYAKRRLDAFTRRVFASYLARLKRHSVRLGASVLDYGCGDGLLIDYLALHGFPDVTGYDAYSERFNDPAVLGRPRPYDLVIAQDVIEHVEDPVGLFQQLVACTKPGGLICLGTPRADDVDLSNVERSIHSLHQPYHLHLLSERALQGIITKGGMTLEALYRRHSCDTPYPFVNWRFLKEYLAAGDDTLDVGFDSPKPSTFLRSPQLILLGLFGYFLPSESEMIVIARKPST
jgi:2-polyprenyl-3-methyl-5-hydroxy-6-metoxy-1,4-benzoquinol methylase